MISALIIFASAYGFSEETYQKPYVPTAAEKKVIKRAQAEFKKAKKAPAPSIHMQNKMQSSVQDLPPVETSKNGSDK